MIHNLSDTVIVVELRPDEWGYYLDGNYLVQQVPDFSPPSHTFGDVLDYPENLPPGNWKIICKGSEATEEQAKDFVEISAFRGGEYNFALGHHQSSGWHKGYKDYVINKYGFLFDTALESLTSFFKSKNLKPGNCLILKSE